jgi:hypothetical protein
MRKLVAVVLLLLLSACDEVASISTLPTDNPKITVDHLFDHEGCKVYRFKDQGESLYYANCNGVNQTNVRHVKADDSSDLVFSGD